MTALNLLMNDATALGYKAGEGYTGKPCVQINASRQFYQYLMSNLNCTVGYPLLVTQKAGYVELYLEYTATWVVRISEELVTGYTAKLL